MHSEKIPDFFADFVTFLYAKDTKEHAASGWCAAVIFWEKVHQICWFAGCDFHLAVKKSSGIYAFGNNSGDCGKQKQLGASFEITFSWSVIALYRIALPTRRLGVWLCYCYLLMSDDE